MRPWLCLLFSISCAGESHAVSIGSKKFTESVVLAELAGIGLARDGLPVAHKAELGGTRILWNALVAGDIDVYPEYTGTLVQEILQRPIGDIEELNAALKPHGIAALPPLGFNNTYAIGLKRKKAEELGLRKISDLAGHPALKLGFGEEFRRRKDGWPGLKAHYRLPHRFVRGLDHDIAYRAVETGDIEVTDLYSTDAEILYHDMAVLEDDRSYFPRYEALFLYRLKTAEVVPGFVESLRRWSGKIDEGAMIAMNRKAKIDKVPAVEVAAEEARRLFGWETTHRAPTRSERVALRSWEHLKMVALSLTAAILAAVPLGFAASRLRGGGSILLIVGSVQTIPALALLVVLIRPLNWIGLSGVGDTPALIALFLYSLLPIVRATHSGLEQIPLSLKETSAVLGLSAPTRLFRIDFPLAFPSILSGVKTAAVMNVGFATLGSLVGAGGFGQPILTGIRLDDYGLILEGAIPAALLALLAQGLFDFLEKRLVSPGLRV